MAFLSWRRGAACAVLLAAVASTTAARADDLAPGRKVTGSITRQQNIVAHRYVATKDGFAKFTLHTSPAWRPYMWIFAENRNRETFSTNGTLTEAVYVIRVKKGDVLRAEVTLAANINGFVAASTYDLTVEEKGR